MRSIRRRIRLNSQDNAVGRVYSFTEAGTRTEYRTVVDPETGACFCNCPDYTFRGRKNGKPCKHIEKHVAALVRKAKRGTLQLGRKAVAA